MFLDDIVGPLSIEEARQSRRMSAQVKLSRALDREREKSRAERERTQRYLDAIMPDKKPEEPKDKEVAEVKQRLDAKCWTGKHKEGTKIKGGVRVNNCVPNESMSETTGDKTFDTMMNKIKKGTGKQATADRKEQKQRNQEQTRQAIDNMFGGNPADKLSIRKNGVAEGHADQQRKVFKKNGKPVGEVGIDRESSPGNGQWYMKCYAYDIDNAGYDSYEEAVAELKHFLKQGVAEDSKADLLAKKKEAKMQAALAAIHASAGAQDEEEEQTGWRAELVDQINLNTFEVKLTNSRSKESANFIVRPKDMMRISGRLQIETMDVRDLQTGKTSSWAANMSGHKGDIVGAVDALFWDNMQLNHKLYDIVDAHEHKGQENLPGLNYQAKVGTHYPADQFLAGQAAISKAKAKAKKGVAEGVKTWDKPGYDLIVMDYYNGGNRPDEIAKKLGLDLEEVEHIIYKHENGVAESDPSGLFAAAQVEQYVACIVDFNRNGDPIVRRTKPLSRVRAEEVIKHALEKNTFVHPPFMTIYPASAGKLDGETIMKQFPDMSKQGVAEGEHDAEFINHEDSFYNMADFAHRQMRKGKSLQDIVKYLIDNNYLEPREVNNFVKQIRGEKWNESVDEGSWDGKHLHTGFGNRPGSGGSSFRDRERNAGLENEVNNIGIMIDGRRWKIFRGEGPEGSQEWFDQRQRMKKMCARKTEQSGKQWTMFITGERPTKEDSWSDGQGQWSSEHDQWAKESVEHTDSSEAVYGAIIRRIIGAHQSLLGNYGPERVMAAVRDVADWNSDVEEIGTSDVSGWVRQVFQKLQNNEY